MRKLTGLALLCVAAAVSFAQQLTPVWVEVGHDGVSLARVVVASPADCPNINIDGSSSRMTLRAPVPQGFAPECEAVFSSGVRSATVNDRALPLPKADPSRIAVFGDTGCRINRNEVQDCNDPAQWPFLRVASRVAAAKPDLVIHVGDYLYREIPCPAEKQDLCGGTPAGDNWEAWKADFFAPAGALLAAAPWAFTRGNHENCERSWRGWFYYLDPGAWTGDVCEPFEAPYRVRLGSFRFVVLDSAAVTENMPDTAIARYAAELAAIDENHAWLVSHHPIWGLRTSQGSSSASPSSPGLIQSWRKSPPKGIDLLVSGHVHLFELLSFDHQVPPQLVSGQGGTNLSTQIDSPLPGQRMGAVKVLAGATARQFGYTLLTRASGGWNLSLNATDDRVLAACAIRGRQASCQK
jgi:hypothetical protein